MRLALGLIAAGGLLWLLFRGTDGAELGAALGQVELGWLVLAQGCLWLALFARAQRWTYVVRASQPASFRSVFSATQIGYLLNFAVPARAGEVARAWLLSRLAGVPVARSLAMVALDRVNDVIGLLMVLGVAAVALAGAGGVELPPGTFGNREAFEVSGRPVRIGASALAGGVVLGAAILVALHAARGPVRGACRAVLEPLSVRLADRASALLDQFADGLRVFGSGPRLLRALFWSLLTWAADVAAVAAIMASFGVAFPWHAPFVVLALVATAIVVPVTPGLVGQFHVPAVVGLLLSIPELDATRAKAIAVVDHLSTLVPAVVAGLWCLSRERLGLGQVLRAEASGTGAGTAGAGSHG